MLIKWLINIQNLTLVWIQYDRLHEFVMRKDTMKVDQVKSFLLNECNLSCCIKTSVWFCIYYVSCFSVM